METDNKEQESGQKPQQVQKPATSPRFWSTEKGLKALGNLFSDEPLTEENREAIRQAAEQGKPQK